MDASKSLTWHPLAALLKGFFINEDGAAEYASFFYGDEENFLDSEYYKLFLEKQVALMIRPWFEMKIIKLIWESYWLALLTNTGQFQDEMLFEIQRMFSCSSSYFKTIAKK
jgi:hypothetical protein